MSSEKVIPNLNKLSQLNNEIKRLSLVLKNIRLQKEETEAEITKYLQEVNQPGIQYQNLIILNKQYKQQKSKNKDDRNKSMIEVLENNGIRNSQISPNIIDRLDLVKYEISGIIDFLTPIYEKYLRKSS